jgi:Fe2+ transport system protein FeoA
MNHMMTLNGLKTGECADVISVDAEKEMKERLRALNVCAGARVKILKIGFFGSSILIEAGGARVGMRKNVAEKIFVRLCQKETSGGEEGEG